MMPTLLARDPAAPLDAGPLGLPLRMRSARREWALPAIVAILAAIGIVLVWAATRSELAADGGNPQSYLYRQLLNVAIGLVLLAIAARIDLYRLRRLGPVLYLVSLLGLFAVLAIGSTINGARAWIVIGGGFEVQPAEFMKLGLIIAMAMMFAERGVGRVADARPSGRDLLFALIVAAVPIGLVMLQPDLGSVLVLCAATFGVLVAAGVRARWTIGLLILGVALILFAAKTGLLASYQLDRFRAFTDPNKDVQGAAYNVNQAHIAIANGHLFGTGLFHGPQTNGAFVPEQQTDFVFSVAGEELGFFGSVGVIGLFGLLCWRGLHIAVAAAGPGRIIASGIICWFGFQAFQNIGMNLGLTPVTGLPLPFVSYGGSSMFAQCLAVGVLLAVNRHSRSDQARRR
jgi:rod shape determining protein RodA